MKVSQLSPWRHSLARTVNHNKHISSLNLPPYYHRHRRSSRFLTTLAIETSCDDTAVAILSRKSRASPNNSSNGSSSTHSLLFNEQISSDHTKFRGIEPLVAVQGHTTSLAPLVRKAMACLPDALDTDEKVCYVAVGEEDVSSGTDMQTTCRRRQQKRKKLPDFISVTRGPGIMPNLSVGLNLAKGLATAWNIPLIGVHHMQAHALTPRLVNALAIPMGTSTSTNTAPTTTTGPEFPFLSLLVSGGHTQLVHSQSLTTHRILATTADIAIGNLLDHTARVILPPQILDSAPDVMYGRLLESFAFPDGGTAEEYSFFYPAASRAEEIADSSSPSGYEWTLPCPLKQSRKMVFSFSGLGSSCVKIVSGRTEEGGGGGMDVAERRVLARHLMASAFSHLAGRLCIALEDNNNNNNSNSNDSLLRISTLVVSGGVACNRFLMHVLRSTLAVRGYGHLEIVAPPPRLCTDNAAMIAWTGMEMFEDGWESDVGMLAINKWPMDPEKGSGIMGVQGWIRRDGFLNERNLLDGCHNV